MEIEKLIEQLRTESLYADKASLEIMDLCMDAATALSTLQVENQALRNAANGFKAENEKLRGELEQVKRERDAAVEDVAAIIGDVEEIRRGYGVDNADADGAFAELCETYCANKGRFCYAECEKYHCKNFKWRGQKED